MKKRLLINGLTILASLSVFSSVIPVVAQADELASVPTSTELVVSNDEINLADIREAGNWEWIGDVLGAIGNLGHFSPSDAERVLDQLNGRYPVRGPVHSCPPGGVGGTPNACNF